jgi:DNA-binding NarL/FixJ family response regulator
MLNEELTVDISVFNCLYKINKILFYKHAIANPQQFLDIKIHFAQTECIAFDDFSEITNIVDISENPVCIIRLEEIRSLDKRMYHSIVDHVEKIKYVSLINPEDLNVVPRLLKSGTKSILFTDDPTSLIIDCIEKTHSYGGYISPRIVAEINKANQHMIDIQYKITARQRQVLQELLKGSSDKIIADNLSISYQTVKSYRKLLYKLFKVSSQGELFALMSL